MSLTSQTFTLSTGRKLGFAEYGDPQGTPFFYFHGWPSSRLQGALLHEVAIKNKLRVIAPDRPGLGLSDYQPNRQLLDWPPVLRELADHLGFEKFHVLGVSGGGPYVMVTAYAMPERVLSAGIICGAPPLKLTGTKGLMWTYRLALFAKELMPWTLGPGLAVAKWTIRPKPTDWPIRWFIATLQGKDRQALADPELYRILIESGRESLSSTTAAIRTDGDIYTSDWGFDPKDIRIPLRIWHGELDKNIPAASVKKIAAMIPKAIPRWFPEDGHYSLPLLHSAEMVEEMMRD